VPAGDLPEQLSLEDCFRLALQANKDIRLADLGTEASRERISGAEGAFDATLFGEVSRGRSDTPEETVPLTGTEESTGALSVGVTKRMETGTDLALAASTSYARTHGAVAAGVLNPVHAPQLSASVTQDLLKGLGRSINRTPIVIAKNNWRISIHTWRNTVIQRLLEVERAYWELYFALADLAVKRRQLERAQRLVDRAKAQVDVGISAPVDVTRAESSVAAQRTAILQAENAISRVRHRLLRAMGIIDVQQADKEFAVASAPPEASYKTTLEQAVAIARAHRPDYAQARLAIENAELNRRYYKNQKLPSLKLFGEYSLLGMGDSLGESLEELDGSYDSWQVGLRFSWPIPNRRARSNFRVAEIQRRQAELRLQALDEQLTREVADALADLKAAEGRIATTAKAREIAERLLKAEERSFSLGRSNSLDVLTAQEELARAERNEIRARADYASALANLFAVQGTLIERTGIIVAEPQGAAAPAP